MPQVREVPLLHHLCFFNSTLLPLSLPLQVAKTIHRIPEAELVLWLPRAIVCDLTPRPSASQPFALQHQKVGEGQAPAFLYCKQ